VKRTTQLSIVVEHRRVAFSLTGAADTAPHPSAGDGPGETGLEPAKARPVCPDCGAPWIAVTAPEGELAASGAAAIDRALQQHGLHTHLSPAGQLSICSKSLEGIQENL
jgi:hypothetical protein